MRAFRSGMLFLAVFALGSGAFAAAQTPPAPAPEQKEKPAAQPSAISLPAAPASSLAPVTAPKSPAPQPAVESAPKSPAEPAIPETQSSAADAQLVLPPGTVLDEASADSTAAPAAVPAGNSHSTRKGGLNFWSPERELEMGKQLDGQMLQQVQLLDDPVITGYLEEIAARIARNSDLEVPVVLRVVESSAPDSFSLPGGFIYITLGMVGETRSEAELAAVISHEVAHIACRHATRQMTRQQMFGLLSIPLMFVGGPVGFAVGEGFTLAYPLTILKFSRNAESEADAVGVGYLSASGYDPNAVVSLFERIASQESQHMVGLRRLFSTHPITKNRVAAVARTIAKLPPNDEYVVSTSRYDEVIVRLARLGYSRDPGIPALIRKTGRHEAEP